ncbi:MAG: ribosome assembly RNA-binding protein YhbY [Lachnospiraceae bacterium]|nr:ribosome assembly RNA-binding protein YhbY [Lachnospiraceae bacterium]
MTSKQRAYLKSLAVNLEPVVHIGKSSVTPELVSSVEEVIAKRELIKLTVLKNCTDDPKDIAEMVAARTRSQVVQVIGKKIVLYRRNNDNPNIVLP